VHAFAKGEPSSACRIVARPDSPFPLRPDAVRCDLCARAVERANRGVPVWSEAAAREWVEQAAAMLERDGFAPVAWMMRRAPTAKPDDLRRFLRQLNARARAASPTFLRFEPKNIVDSCFRRPS